MNDSTQKDCLDIDMMLEQWKNRSQEAAATHFDPQSIKRSVRARLSEPEQIQRKSFSRGHFRFSIPKVVSTAAAMFFIVSGIVGISSGNLRKPVEFPYYTGSDGSSVMVSNSSKHNIDSAKLNTVSHNVTEFTEVKAPFNLEGLHFSAAIESKVEHVWLSNGEFSPAGLDKLSANLGAPVKVANNQIDLKLNISKRNLSSLVDSLSESGLELLSSAQPQPLQRKFVGNPDEMVEYTVKIIRP
ncbi:MAG: hypothetical protein MST10_09695 [Lentisphaeria bacterium]|nr:hypothetical protein [Lentisphaeria bacterium]